MEPTLICISGGIASGKSTVASRVAAALGIGKASFGDHVRSIAVQRGLDSQDRIVLQEVGADLIANSLDSFCRAVLAQAEWSPGRSAILDGLRHIQTLEHLRQLVSPMSVFLVSISLSSDQRQERACADVRRRGSNISQYDYHSTEVQVREVLPREADLILDGTEPADGLAKKIIQAVSGQSVRSWIWFWVLMLIVSVAGCVRYMRSLGARK